MEYLTVKEIAKKWNITERCVQNYCINSKIPGAKSIGKQWLIPSNSERPCDGRLKNSIKKKNEEQYHFPMLVFTRYFNSTSELSDEELSLLEIQKIFLQGKYLDCLMACRKLQEKHLTNSVTFAIHCMVGYTAMTLGLSSEFLNVVEILKKLLKKEEYNNEDYKLLFAGLVFHGKRNGKDIYKIDPSAISPDAIYYYQYLILISFLTDKLPESEFSLSFYEAYLKQVENDGITPLALSVNCMISRLYFRYQNDKKRLKYMQNTCKILAKTGWIGLIVKYSVVDFDAINSCLIKYDPKIAENLKKLNNQILINYEVVHKIFCNTKTSQQFSNLQNDLLMLIAYEIPKSSISFLTGLPEEEIDKTIDELIKICGVNSFDELTKYVCSKIK